MEVTVREMTNEAIEKIKAAEAEDVAIRSDADAKAEKMKAEAKARGEALLASTEESTRAEIDRMFAELKEKSDRLIEKSREDAGAEAKELRRTAQFRMHAASEEIIRGIYRQCQ